MFCLIASRKWQIHSIGVTTAFLQGNDLEQNVLVRPPKKHRLTEYRNCVSAYMSVFFIVDACGYRDTYRFF